jgi:hypothetical protein
MIIYTRLNVICIPHLFHLSVKKAPDKPVDQKLKNNQGLRLQPLAYYQ